MAIFSLLKGYKTYLAAAGLVGLAVFQFSTGMIPQGIQSLLGALTAIGLRGAIADLKS